MSKTLDEVGVKRLIQEIKGATKTLNTPLVIKTSNSDDDKAANVKAIEEYLEKAKAAGVDTSNYFIAPVDGGLKYRGFLFIRKAEEGSTLLMWGYLNGSPGKLVQPRSFTLHNLSGEFNENTLMGNSVVIANYLANDAVVTEKIKDGSVTTAKLDKVVRDKIDAATDYTIPVTWEELKSLRDGGELIPGQTYHITDFVTTSVQSETRSAGHPFDIIVVADTESVLNENAHACLHEGDTYFADCKLNAWELKYCFDNDAERFAWADMENGKGVIWWMRDEWDNECFYDFKNIQYRRYKVTSTQDNTADLVDSCPYLGNINQNSEGLSKSDTADFKWVYTFTKYTPETDLIEDGSLIGKLPESEYGTMGGCYGNRIDALYVSVTKDDGGFVKTLTLNNGMYWTNGNYKEDYNPDRSVICFLNKVGGDCYDFTGLQGVINTTCGNGCYSWTCGNGCYSWTCGNDCYSWTCGNDCDSWTCGNGCDSWTCGNGCYSWTCGNGCYSWTCGNGCYSWTCGNEVSGTKVLQNFVSHFRLESDVHSITIKSSRTPTGGGEPLKNFVVKAGIHGTSSSKLAIVIDAASFPLGSNYEWIIAKNSKGQIKQYCEADLIN